MCAHSLQTLWHSSHDFCVSPPSNRSGIMTSLGPTEGDVLDMPSVDLFMMASEALKLY